jgi:hypothetical protein
LSRNRGTHRPALILLFAKKFFRVVATASCRHARGAPAQRGGYNRMRWNGRMFWLLAFGPASTRHTSFPPSPPKTFGDWLMGSCIQLQQRNCSRFPRDFSRRSTFPSSQRTGSRSSCLRSALQDLFLIYSAGAATNRRPSATIEPSAANAASCSAKAWMIASRFSVTTIAPAKYRK